MAKIQGEGDYGGSTRDQRDAMLMTEAERSRKKVAARRKASVRA